MVREESHLDDMRAAIRGDFERLAERRGSQELMRDDVADDSAPTSEHAAEPGAPSPEPAPEPEVEPIETPPEAEAEPIDAPQPANVAPEDTAQEDAAPRKSWLARVLGL